MGQNDIVSLYRFTELGSRRFAPCLVILWLTLLLCTPLKATEPPFARPVPGIINQGHAGTWLRFGEQKTVLLQGRKLSQTALQLMVAASASSALVHLAALGQSKYPTLPLLAQFARLLLPAYYLFYHTLSGQNRWLNHGITLSRYPTSAFDTLAQLSIELQRDASNDVEQLVFSQPPQALTPRPSTEQRHQPLARFARMMTLLGSDHLILRWTALTRSLEIIVGGAYFEPLTITMPTWGMALFETRKQIQAPSILQLLQHDNLETLGSLLLCVIDPKSQALSNPLCHEANLSRGSSLSKEWRWSDSTHPLVPISNEERSDTHYLLPLTSEASLNESQNSTKPTSVMTLSWPISPHSSALLPEPPNPLMLHIHGLQKFAGLAQQGLTKTPPTVVVPAQAIDHFAIAPYALLGLLTDYLASVYVMPPALKWLGIGLGSAYAGHFHGGYGYDGYDYGGDYGGGWQPYPYYDDGKAYGSYSSPYLWSAASGFDPSQSTHDIPWQAIQARLRQNQTQLIRAIEEAGAPQPETGSYQQQATDIPTLTHKSNNCFFNAVTHYLAHSLTDRQLQGIAQGHFIPAKMIKLHRKELTRLRQSFVALVNAMQQETPAKTTRQEWQQVQTEFHSALLDYATVSRNVGLRRLLLGNSISTRLFSARQSQTLFQQQADAHELLNALLDVLGITNDRSNTLIINNAREVHIGNETGIKTHISAANRYHTLAVSLPNVDRVRSSGIIDINGVINDNFLAKTWVGNEDDFIYVSAQEAREMGIQNASAVQKGGLFPFFDQANLNHKHMAKFTHINIALKLYERGHKIRGVSRRWLHGDGRIVLPVKEFDSQSTHQIALEPTAMILHAGTSSSSGHYITANFRNGYWHIFDDLDGYAVQLRPHGDTQDGSSTPLDLLSSYLEDHDLDPYIIHYRRL